MKLERRAHERGRLAAGAVLGGALVAGAALAALWLRLGLPVPRCVFRDWTGLPCPTCGSTRMVEALLSGKVVEAAAWNPLIFGGLTAVALWSVLSVARVAFGLPTWHLVLLPRERLGMWLFAAAVLVAGWAYVVWRAV